MIDATETIAASPRGGRGRRRETPLLPAVACVVMLLVAGCDVTAKEIECCQERCERNGGVMQVSPKVPGGHTMCHCENGATFGRACEASR